MSFLKTLAQKYEVNAAKISPTDWAKREVKNIKIQIDEEVGGVYLALMDMDHNQYDIEIEVSDGVIGGTYSAGDLKKSRKAADDIEKVLKANGIKVFKTRSAWEKAVYKD